MTKHPGRRKHVPQRTCMVCREKTDKRRLTRLVRTADEGVVADPTGKRNGRGAYVCSKLTCWDTLLAGRILDQALRTQVTQAEKELLARHRPLATTAI